MKFAILADIHGHLEALNAVLADSRDQECTHYACAGDLVGYGPNPGECVDIIRQMAMPCVKGNHDEYCSMDEPPDGFNPQAAEAVIWTRNQLTDDEKRWLRDLPYFLTVADFSLVHATLDGPQSWAYVFDKLAAAASFSHQKTTVCFFAHTHVPLAFIREPVGSGQWMVKGGTYSKFKVDPSKKHFVNVGSIGQPRDNDPRAAYAIYDLDEGTIELRRMDIGPMRRRPGDSGMLPRPR